MYAEGLGVLFQATVGDGGNAEHDQREAEEAEPVTHGTAGAGIAEAGENQLREVIGGKKEREFLEHVRQHHNGNPKSSAEAHGQIDHVDDAGGRVEGNEQCDRHAEAGEGDGADEGQGHHPDIFRKRDRDVGDGDAEQREKADDDQSKGGSGTALRNEIGERGHGAGALELEPTGAELAGEATANTEQRCTGHAEDGVAGEHVLGDRNAANVLAAIHDEAEEEIEDYGKSDDGEREGASTKEADELEAGFREEDAKGAREGVRAGGGK